jgi:phosphoribosyl 1,2-cyclic phosphodiesterase
LTAPPNAYFTIDPTVFLSIPGPSVLLECMSIMVSVLGSGSRGNATYIRTDRVRLLIDCGFGRRTIRKRLAAIGEDPDGITAVLVTHEHSDHVGGLKSMLKDSSIEAFMSCGTIAGSRADSFEMKGSAALVPVVPGRRFQIGDVEVEPFAVPHDSAEPIAFSVRHKGIKVTQVTDLGWIPDSVSSSLQGSDVLIIESNHDLDMLRIGSYPWHLKERLIGRNGHLSNSAVGRFLGSSYDGQAQHVVLAHLSSKNNHPEIAKLEARQALGARGFDENCVSLASQAEPSTPIELG